tara:strand:+ start:1022 stop:1183 length:162 start_codon:yes stop_codon:yes gene_type:complete
MIEFLLNMFGFNKSQKEKVVISKTKKVYHEHDIIDYDGMGNQGRFPIEENKKR